ncbi:MAG: hypothetical protein L6R28_07200 [Planctomycetes bacterium]|nr:hypothetical protein [Planctomycetota bacterium]
MAEDRTRTVCVELDRALCFGDWTPNARKRYEAPEAVAKLRAKGWKVYICTRHLWEASEDTRADITRWLAKQGFEVDGLYPLPPASVYLQPRAFGTKIFGIVDFSEEALFDEEEEERERIREEARRENEATLKAHRQLVTKRFHLLVSVGMPSAEAARFLDGGPSDEQFMDKLDSLQGPAPKAPEHLKQRAERGGA